MDISGEPRRPGSLTGKPELALFGGAFNPVHMGHLALASEVEKLLDLSEIVFIPTGWPPHKEIPEVSCEERLHMVDLAIRDHPRWRTSDVECRNPGPSYTARTVEILAIDPPPFFVMGTDAFADFWTWGGPETILSRTHLVIVSRPGSLTRGVSESLRTVLRAARTNPEGKDPESLLATLDLHSREWATREIVWSLPAFRTTIRFLRIRSLPISSTELRRYLAREGQGNGAILLPERVKSYIVKKGFYRQGSVDQNPCRS